MRSRAPLALAALGVVFGDIGTSPLYALRTILGEGGDLDRTTLFGLTSTAIWSMVVVVTVLYVGLLMRTDNDGEGGLLALVALLRRTTRNQRLAGAGTLLGMLGASAFLGDSVITPAISVLAAAEGLEVVSASLHVVVVPLALALLVGIFLLQRVGSGKIGRFYGPVMVVWFAVLAVAGAVSLAHDPQVLEALSPQWVVVFFVEQPRTAFLALGAVVLAITGAEALYTDLGHFGRPAILRAWLLVVLPVLVLSYLGETAAVLRDRSAAGEPFYAVVPGWATIPVVVLATAATVIASQAVIAGAFTVLHQAGGLGLLPYLRVKHPSAHHAGQIYVPAGNWTLAVAVLLVVVAFRSSDRLSSAYGVAVSATFVVDATVFVLLVRARGGHRAARGVAVACGLVVLAFFAATVPKLADGGWVPAGIAAVLFVVMTTWWSGQRRLRAAVDAQETSPTEVLEETRDVRRVAGSGVFLTRDKELAPIALRALIDTTATLPEQVVLLSWHVEDTPSASAHESRVDVDTFDGRFEGVVGVDVALGYRERLDVVHVLGEACQAEQGVLAAIDPDRAAYFVSQPIPRLERASPMARWRQRLFLVLDRLATDRVDQLELPRDRTIVVGRELEL